MQNTEDLLQIKIEQAKSELPKETIASIDAVNWRAIISGIAERAGYGTEQLDDLETETELLLYGLVSPESYPVELEKRMGISNGQAKELAGNINSLVLRKIMGELVKNTEKKKNSTEKSQVLQKSAIRENNNILERAGIKIIETLPAEGKLEISTTKDLKPNTDDVGLSNMPANKEKSTSIFAQKLSSKVQTSTAKTDHTLENVSKTNTVPIPSVKIDPYREIPE